MAIGNKDRELAKKRFDANPPECVTWPANLNSGCVRIIGNDAAMRKGKEALKEVSNTHRRNVDAVLRYCLKCGVCGFSRVPVKLHVDSTRPLNDCIAADWVRKRSDEYVCAVCFGG